MIVLGLDSATAACSAAIWQDGRILARRFEEMSRGQAEALVPMARAVVVEAGLRFTDLDRVGVTVGPGAFTGLRIGLAAARGIALAAGADLIGITSLTAVAAAAFAEDAHPAGPLLVALETKRADLYVQLFAVNQSAMTEPFVARAADLAARLPGHPARIAGDGAQTALAAFAASASGLAAPALCIAGLPDAATVAALAAARAETHVAPEPIYLRAPDVTPEPAGGKASRGAGGPG